jgi:hypothetical protein
MSSEPTERRSIHRPDLSSVSERNNDSYDG